MRYLVKFVTGASKITADSVFRISTFKLGNNDASGLVFNSRRTVWRPGIIDDKVNSIFPVHSEINIRPCFSLKLIVSLIEQFISGRGSSWVTDDRPRPNGLKFDQLELD